MDEIKKLKKELSELDKENAILDLKIRIARAEKRKQDNESELERLQDPDEPMWPNECACNGPF